MKIISYISTISIPFIIFVIVLCGIKEKKNIYELFIEGAKEGMKTVVQLFPTLLAIFLSVGMLRSSGILEIIIKGINSLTRNNIFPMEVFPLAIMKPISGSAAIAIGTDIIKNYGVDSRVGRIAATIMGSTETTLYIIAVYTSKIKIKKTRHILIAALLADLTGIITSVAVWNWIF